MKEFANQLHKYLTNLNQNLTFEPNEHHYFVKGKRVRSVSSIVSEYDPTFAHKIAQDETFREYCEAKARVGTAFHKTTEKLEFNELTPDTSILKLVINVSEEVKRHCKRWWQWFYKPFVLGGKWSTIAVELPLYHPVFNFCGTLDRLFLNDKEEVILVDYKTGAFYPNHEIQLALYGLLCENVGVKVDKYVVVSTHPTKGGYHEINPRVIKALLKQPKLQQILKGV